MKFLLKFSFSVLIATLLLNFLPVHGEEAVYDDTVRLHVIAASDSAEDQNVKLKVRDSILRCVGEKMKTVNHRKADISY